MKIIALLVVEKFGFKKTNLLKSLESQGKMSYVFFRGQIKNFTENLPTNLPTNSSTDLPKNLLAGFCLEKKAIFEPQKNN